MQRAVVAADGYAEGREGALLLLTIRSYDLGIDVVVIVIYRLRSDAAAAAVACLLRCLAFLCFAGSLRGS